MLRFLLLWGRSVSWLLFWLLVLLRVWPAGLGCGEESLSPPAPNSLADAYINSLARMRTTPDPRGLILKLISKLASLSLCLTCAGVLQGACLRFSMAERLEGTWLVPALNVTLGWPAMQEQG